MKDLRSVHILIVNVIKDKSMCMRVIFELEVEIDGNYDIKDIEDYYAFQFGLTKHLPSDNALAKEKVLYSEVTNIQVLQYEENNV